MARQPRENLEDGIYHVYARGNARADVFSDDVDRKTYLWMLGNAVRDKDWRCLAYCLMANHIHLLLETPQANLSSGMQCLHGGYAQFFNRRHERTGHVFQGRYGATRILSDRQLCATAAYIARNPVDAGLCKTPGEWRWSSFRAVVEGGRPDWLDGERLLSYFSTRRDGGREHYADLSGAASAETFVEGLTP
jgi:putative transposase